MKVKKIFNAVFTGVIVLVIMFAGINHFKVRSEINKLRVVERELDQKSMELNDKLKSLNYDLENSNTYEFIEKAARKQGMIKPREIIIYDLDKDKK
ncbi:septum formation initiator family protein [uncultured Ezakiella sp.]|uniref:FtsB family cell division protein n=1 Tax=uncultured Ezakiella sp. TaxID=1637529 RepID=UPI0025D71ED8|nr:septum formation initiator family protein [uncultured Ezakiella sp.]